MDIPNNGPSRTTDSPLCIYTQCTSYNVSLWLSCSLFIVNKDARGRINLLDELFGFKRIYIKPMTIPVNPSPWEKVGLIKLSVEIPSL